jgi:hypothetical protein
MVTAHNTTQHNTTQHNTTQHNTTGVEQMKTTLNKIRKHRPCTDGWETLLRTLDKTKTDDEPVSIIQILDSNGLNDALWCLRAVEGYEREIRRYAVWCARQVQHLLTDPRSLNALDVAERYANGEASREELVAAWANANAAADAAADVARAAARAAADADARGNADAANAANAAANAANAAANAANALDAAATTNAANAANAAAVWAAWAAGDAVWSAAAAAAAARGAQERELRRIADWLDRS